jgi:peptide chain release factor subunit 1
MERTYDRLKELALVKGTATTNISLFIGANKDVNTIMSMLRSEISLASNIKSKETKKLVNKSLEVLVSTLKKLKITRAPAGGVALFAGQCI